MIKISVNRKSNLGNIVNQLPKVLFDGLKQALDRTREAVISAKDMAVRYPNEILDSEIKVEVLSDGIKGKVFTDGERVLFIEYGTGTFAEMPHIGKTKTFIESGYSMWLLPVEKSPVDFGVDHRITIGNYDYFLMLPTQATHFFTNTAFMRRDENVDEIRTALAKMIREEEI